VNQQTNVTKLSKRKKNDFFNDLYKVFEHIQNKQLRIEGQQFFTPNFIGLLFWNTNTCLSVIAFLL